MFKCEHNGVLFPSVADDEFRTKVSRTKDGLVFWIESKGSKQQWQKTVANIAECGPAGMPEEAILALLKVNSSTINSSMYSIFSVHTCTHPSILFILLYYADLLLPLSCCSVLLI